MLDIFIKLFGVGRSQSYKQVWAREPRPYIVLFLFLLLSSSSFSYASETTLYFGSMEKNLNTGEKKIYIPVGNSIAVKTLNSNGSTKNTSYIHSDHLGSTVLITKQDGTIDSSLSYYPFGNVSGSTSLSNTTDKLYTGQRKDTNTSLYFYNARYYNPKTGRFISADSAQGSNRYAYVGNNPVMMNDPSGNREEGGEGEHGLTDNFYIQQGIKENGIYADEYRIKYGITLPQDQLYLWDKTQFTVLQQTIDDMVNISGNKHLFMGVTFQNVSGDYSAEAHPETNSIWLNGDIWNSTRINEHNKEFSYTIAHEFGHLKQPGLERGVNGFNAVKRKEGIEYGTYGNNVTGDYIEGVRGKFINPNAYVASAVDPFSDYSLRNSFESFAVMYGLYFYPDEGYAYQPNNFFMSGGEKRKVTQPLSNRGDLQKYFPDSFAYMDKLIKQDKPAYKGAQ